MIMFCTQRNVRAREEKNYQNEKKKLAQTDLT